MVVMGEMDSQDLLEPLEEMGPCQWRGSLQEVGEDLYANISGTSLVYSGKTHFTQKGGGD